MRGFGFAIGLPPEDEARVAAGTPHPALRATELVARLAPLRPRRVVLEATGDFEASVVAALIEAGLQVLVVNPRQVRDVAKAMGYLAKTDAIDARVLAHFAAVTGPSRSRCPRRLPASSTRGWSGVAS